MPYGHASMLLLGEGSEATEPYKKYDIIRPHSIRSLQFDQKVRPLSFRPENFDLFTATRMEQSQTQTYNMTQLNLHQTHIMHVSAKRLQFKFLTDKILLSNS